MLIEILHLHGCIVTIDAMGCQKEIVASIADKGANYVISLKGKQGKLHEATAEFFRDAREEKFETVEHAFTETLDKDTAASSAAATGSRRRSTGSVTSAKSGQD